MCVLRSVNRVVVWCGFVGRLVVTQHSGWNEEPVWTGLLLSWGDTRNDNFYYIIAKVRVVRDDTIKTKQKQWRSATCCSFEISLLRC